MGAIRTNTSISAAMGQFSVNGSDGSVGVGAGNKIYLNGTNGKVIATGGVQAGSGGGSLALLANGYVNVTQNAYIGGVTMANGGLVVSGATPSGNALKVNGVGSVSQGATDATGAVSASNASTIANGTDLTRITDKAAFDATTKADAVQGNLNTYKTTNDAAVALKADKVQVAADIATAKSEAIATASTDATTKANNALTSANTYTDGKVGAINATVSTLTATVNANATTAANATAQVQTHLNTAVTKATAEVNRLDGRIDTTNQNLVAEENKRIAEDVRVLNQANTYTDQQVQAQSQQDRAYTNQQVSNERDRAMAVEANLQKQINAVGAMSMATAAINTAPTQGDKKTQIGVGVGSYGGSSAVAVGLSHSTEGDVNNMSGGKTRVYVRYTATISQGSGGKTGVGAGMTFGF